MRVSTPYAPGLAGGARPIARPRPPKLGALGVVLAITALLLGASALPEARFDIGGMLVHPSNFGVVLILAAVGARRIRLLPDRVSAGLLAFSILYVLATLLASNPVNPMVKFLASVLTILAGAIAVTSDRAFRAATTAAVASVGAVALRSVAGMNNDSFSGVNPMQGVANENAFSLYALPVLLLAMYHAISSETPRIHRIICALGSMAIVFALFSTGNRSGWLGAVLIAGVLSLRAVRRVRTLLLLAAVSALTAYLVLHYGNLKMIDMNITITEEGYASDELRVALIKAGLQTGLEHPLLGVSPQRLPVELGRIIRYHSPRGIDAHNVFALIIGGCGFLTTIALGVFGWGMARKSGTDPSPRASEAHFLLRAMLLLWCVRGMFGGEVLYSPAFSLCLGMCIGYCLQRGVWAKLKVPKVGRIVKRAVERPLPAPQEIV